jgi:hypothetical protein
VVALLYGFLFYSVLVLVCVSLSPAERVRCAGDSRQGGPHCARDLCPLRWRRLHRCSHARAQSPRDRHVFVDNGLLRYKEGGDGDVPREKLHL